MTLQDILKNPNTLIVRVRMDIFKFIEKFRSPSHYFRTLAHSNSSIGRRKNREFFKKYVEGGAYRTDLSEEGLSWEEMEQKAEREDREKLKR